MSQKIKTSVEIDGSLTANSIVKSGGTASQILAADGSVVTAGSGVTISGGTISASGSAGVLSFNTRTGAVTLTSGDVTTALGYAPYNASNPAGYISSYTETDTLASVTARGSLTNTPITIAAGTLNHVTLGDRFNLIGGSNLHITNNAYYDSGFKYKFADLATKLALQADGILSYQTAVTGTVGSAVTFDTKFSVDSSGNLIVPGTLSASGYNKTNWDTAYGWGNHASAGYATSGHTHGLGRHNLAAPALIDSLTTSNFRSTFFGTSANDYQISTARFNSVPAPFSGLNMYGTAFAWSGADTHGFLAVDYIGAAAIIGGGNGQSINWTKRLAFLDDTVPNNRTITINGTSYDLSANRSWTVTASETDTLATVVARGNSANTSIAVRNSISINKSDGSSGGQLSYDSSINQLYLWNSLSSGYFSVYTNNAERLNISSGGAVTANVDMRAPIFYDSNNTGFYGDFASTSNFNKLLLNSENSFNTSTPGLTSYGLTLMGGTSDYANGVTWTWGNTNAQAGIYVQSSGAYGTKMYFATTDSFATGAKTAMAIDHYGNVSLNRGTFNNGSVWINNGVNYNSYNENIRLFNATNGVSVIAFGASGTSGTPQSSILGFSDRLEIRVGSNGTAVQRNYDNYVEAMGSSRAPIFYDSNNTGYYVDPASTSNLNGLTVGGSGVLTYGNAPRAANSYVMFYEGFTLNANDMSTNSTGFTYSNNAPWTGPIARFSTGGGYDLWLNASYGGDGTALSYRTRNGDAGTHNSWHRIYSDSYKPNADKVNGYGGYDHVGSGLRPFYNWGGSNGGASAPNGSTYTNGISVGSHPSDPAYGFQIANNMWNTGLWTRSYNSYSFDGWVRLLDSSNYSQYCNFGGNTVYGGIFYDGNNTAYYVNPDSTSRVAAVVADNLYSINNIYLESNYGSSVIGLYNSTRYQGVYSMGSAYKLALDGTTTGNLYGLAWAHPNAGGVSGNLNTHGLLALENGTWLASLTGSTRARDDMRAPIFYDNNDTTYYSDPASTSGECARFAGGIVVSRGNVTGNGIILADDGDIVDLNDGYCAMRFSSGVRIHSGNRTGGVVHTLHSNGTFTASGDVVAYSDERVKENINTIEYALDKVKALRGVTYNRTDKKDKSEKVGVIAQEIKEVLPQVVFEQEDGMLGVSYGNITAVLIEAIKEQQTQIEELKELVNKLINK